MPDLRYAVRRLARQSRFYGGQCTDPGAGHWREHRDLQRDRGRAAETSCPIRIPSRSSHCGTPRPGINITELNLAASLYFTYSEESRVFQDVGMWTPDTATITGVAEPEEVPALPVTNRFLPVLGVQPALGRGFTASDDDPKSERTVMLSDGYWRSRFGGDRSVLGRRILVDGNAYAK